MPSCATTSKIEVRCPGCMDLGKPAGSPRGKYPGEFTVHHDRLEVSAEFLKRTVTAVWDLKVAVMAGDWPDPEEE